MIHVRVLSKPRFGPIRFAFGAIALSTTITTFAACVDQPPASNVEEPEAGAPEASLPPSTHDAGLLDVDADPSKRNHDASDELVACTATPCVKQLVAGLNQFCALLSDGTVRCWGQDHRGSLGRGESDGSDNTGTTPEPVIGIVDATQISASSWGTTTCARNARGRVQCWGSNEVALLGLRVSPALVDSLAHPTPANVALGVEIARVDVGQTSACALGMSDDVYCWGDNGRCQLARPDAGVCDPPSYDYEGPGPAEVSKYKITRIAGGRDSIFAITKEGQLVNWGTISGRDSSLESTSVPLPLSLPASGYVTPVETTNDMNGFPLTCAIADGRVYCWGWNRRGGIGTGVPNDERLPVLAELLTDDKTFPQQLAMAPTSSCVRMTDGSIQCCGSNQVGQLGLGDIRTTLVSLFTRATAFKEYAVQVAVSSNATCALIQGGKVMCWGGNSYGELGQGTRDSDAHPIPTTVVFE